LNPKNNEEKTPLDEAEAGLTMAEECTIPRLKQ
jgi:hypothetical protein